MKFMLFIILLAFMGIQAEANFQSQCLNNIADYYRIDQNLNELQSLQYDRFLNLANYYCNDNFQPTVRPIVKGRCRGKHISAALYCWGFNQPFECNRQTACFWDFD